MWLEFNLQHRIKISGLTGYGKGDVNNKLDKVISVGKYFLKFTKTFF
jgi:hypothetical protein